MPSRMPATAIRMRTSRETWRAIRTASHAVSAAVLGAWTDTPRAYRTGEREHAVAHCAAELPTRAAADAVVARLTRWGIPATASTALGDARDRHYVRCPAIAVRRS